MEQDTRQPDPGFPPYYSALFFETIRGVKDSGLNPIYLTVKQWYEYLLEKMVTTREIDQEGRRQKIPNRIEENSPGIQWGESYRLARLHGLAPASKSFLFKLIHELLPSRERVNRMIPANSALCWCGSGEVETYLHCFYKCNRNSEAAAAMLQCAQVYDHELTPERSLRLQVKADEVFSLPVVSIIATGLQTIWNNRQQKKAISFLHAS